MPTLISASNNYDILQTYSSRLIPRTLLNAGLGVYKELKRTGIEDRLYGLDKDFLTNEKFVPYTSHIDDFDNLINPTEDTRTFLFGHYINKPFFGIEYDSTKLNHLIDLVNASFMTMNNNPSLANAMLQSLFLLIRIYKEDIPIEVSQEVYGGVYPNDI